MSLRSFLRTDLSKHFSSFFREAALVTAVLIFSIFLFAPHHSEALIIFPSFDLTVVKNTLGGDENFSFHYRAFGAGSPIPYQTENFNIQTAGGTGSNFVSAFFASPGDTIFLTEDPLE